MVDMPTVDLSLGRLDVESKESGWRAEVQNTATFAASREDHLDRLSQRLTEGVLNEYSDGSPWIIRGHSFCLILTLRFGTLLGTVEQDGISATLAAWFGAAQLWDQLCLVPNSVETSQAGQGCQKITVFLQYGQNSFGQAVRRLHKLDTDVPFQDMQPPSGINIVALDAVHLDIKFEPGTRWKRQKLEQHRGALRESSPSEDRSSPTILPIGDAITFSQLPQEQTIWGIEMDGDSPHSAFDEWLLDAGDEVDETLEFDDDYMLLQPERDDNSTHEHSSIPPLLKRSSSASSFDINAPANRKQDVLALVDAAIRYSISRTPRHLPKGIVMTANESLQQLSPLAPSLWCPQYLPSLASRAVFIPTISHALKRICTHTYRSTSKSAKAVSSVEHSGESSMSASSQQDGTAAISTTAVSRLTWRLLARGMYDNQPAKRLAPLSVAIGDNTQDPNSEFEMLDSWQSGLQTLTRHTTTDFYPNDIAAEEHNLFVDEELLCEDELLDDGLSVCESLELLNLLEYEDENPSELRHDTTECLQLWEDVDLLDI